jgi:2-polyprenyl-6-methoxyphenol hydroxylase-like FAD-dependent oxidoreductase
MRTGQDYDAVVVGASLAGCSTAMLLARRGARVALVERSPDPEAFKRVCGHFIQSSAVPALERLGLLDEMEAAGAARSRIRLWTRWGRVEIRDSLLPPAVNIRREVLDPMLRRRAAETPGVELMAGWTATAILTDDGRATGIEVTDRSRARTTLRAWLVVGADGRDSHVARLAGVKQRSHPHGRFSYAAYYQGPPPAGAPDGTIWMLDPQWAAAFPTDGGLTLYGCMPTKDRLPEFRRDLEGAFTSYMADLPDPPPILASRRVGRILGKIEMPNVDRDPGRHGVALVGDAALATDPLWGVGCGWAFESAEWLADSIAAALAGDEPIEDGLRRYRRRFARSLRGHAMMINDYATGRRFQPVERALFATAVADPRAARRLEAFATRNAGPERLLAPGMVGAMVAAGARRLVGRRGNGAGTPRLETVA